MRLADGGYCGGEDIYEGKDGKLNSKVPAKRLLIAEILFAFVAEFGKRIK